MRGEYFLTSDAYPVLTEIVKSRNLKGARCLFLTTAADGFSDPQTKLNCYRHELRLLKKLGLHVEVDTLSRKTPHAAAALLEGVDVLYNSGGETAYNRRIWGEARFMSAARKFKENGGIVICDSASTVIMGGRLDIGYTPSYWSKVSLPLRRGFGLVNADILVHWGNYLGGYQQQYDDFPKGTDSRHVIKLRDDQWIHISSLGAQHIRTAQNPQYLGRNPYLLTQPV